MAAKKKTSAVSELFDWGKGGAVHKISKEQHAENVRARQTPVKPTPGSYDPNLDAQERAAGRQLDYLTSDSHTGELRAQSALDTGTTLTDRGYQRSLGDLLQARSRGEHDYGTNLNTLTRNYQNLGASQGGSQRKAGAFAGSGAAIQSAQKREANQATDRAPIDEAFRRFNEDNTTAQGRALEDRDTNIGALGETYANTHDDLGTALTRAQNENTFFGQDTAAARSFQSSALGHPVVHQAPNVVKAATPPVMTVTAGANTAGGTTKVRRRKGKPSVVTYGASVGGP